MADSGRGPLFAVNCSILFTELPLLERPAAARAAGFEAVEFWWPFDSAVPSDAEVERFERAIRDAGVALVGLNFAAGDMPGGDRGLVSCPQRCQEFRDNIAVAVGIGERLGCRGFNALYGNRVEGEDPAVQDELAVQNLALAARAASAIGGTVMLEPLSGTERYPLLSASDAVNVIDRVNRHTGATGLGLLADLYHLAVNGDDLDKVVATYTSGSRTCRSRMRRVVMSPAPGRWRCTGISTTCTQAATTGGSAWSTSRAVPPRRASNG